MLSPLPVALGMAIAMGLGTPPAHSGSTRQEQRQGTATEVRGGAYRRAFRASLDPLPDDAALERALRRSPPGKLAARALTFSRAASIDDEDQLRAISEAYLDRLLDVLADNPQELWNDFHVITPAALCAQARREEGRWSARDDQRLQPAARAAAEAYLAGPRMTHGNRDVSKVAGIATLAALSPTDPLWREVGRRVDGFLDRMLEVGDLDENSGNYASLGLLRFLHAVRARDRLDQLHTRQWHAVFARYRDLVSPAGRMPEWGDDYFKVDPQLHWVTLFEFAASFWSDPTFAATALRMFRARSPDAKFEEADLARSVDLLDLELLPLAPNEVEWPSPSSLTWRTTARGRRALDKLILGHSREPGAAMVMMDLYCRGDHTHLDKRGSITFYESEHVPHFTNYGRYRQSAAHANLVLATPPGTTFPPGDWRPGAWITQSLPTDRLPAPPDDPDQRVLSTMSLRAHPSKDQEWFWLDRLRLEGPAGILPVDEFDELHWRRNQHLSVVDLDGGERAMRVELASLHFHGPRYELQFDPLGYTHLRYEARYQSPRQQVPRVQARFPGGYDSWHFVGQSTLLADVTAARVECDDDASRAHLTLSPYLELDSQLQRQVVLLRDGTLLIRDDLDPGPRLDGHTGGALWQLSNVAARGSNWFHALANRGYRSPRDGREHRRDQLVVFACADRSAATCGVRTIPGGKGGSTLGGTTDLHTSFVSRTLTAGERTTLITIVRPVAPGGDPAELAANIAVVFEDLAARIDLGGRTVTLPAPP